jgi:hypothetical protein
MQPFVGGAEVSHERAEQIVADDPSARSLQRRDHQVGAAVVGLSPSGFGSLVTGFVIYGEAKPSDRIQEGVGIAVMTLGGIGMAVGLVLGFSYLGRQSDAAIDHINERAMRGGNCPP